MTPRAPSARKPPVRTPRAPAARKTAAPAFRFRARVLLGDTVVIGPGKIALLEAIASTGSITAAAKQLEMSYRHAWLLLDDVNRTLRTPAIASTHGGDRGGGSALTETGRKLVALYRRIEAQALAACGNDIKALVAMLGRA